jgi:hypothetical protein
MKSSNILGSQVMLTLHYEGGTFPSKRHKLITLQFSVRTKKTKVVDKFRALRVEGEYTHQTKANENNPERVIGLNEYQTYLVCSLQDLTKYVCVCVCVYIYIYIYIYT